jgi:hypothetical protein
VTYPRLSPRVETKRGDLIVCRRVETGAVALWTGFLYVCFRPRFVGAPKQGAAPQRDDYATGARRSRPTPCRQPEHRSHQDEERSGRQLDQDLPDEWRRGVGRPARQSGGDTRGVVRTKY